MKIAKRESFCQIFRVFFDMRKLIPLKVSALKVHNSVQVFSLINCVPLSIVVHSLSSLCNTSNNRNETNPAFYFGVLLNNYSFFIYIYTQKSLYLTIKYNFITQSLFTILILLLWQSAFFEMKLTAPKLCTLFLSKTIFRHNLKRMETTLMGQTNIKIQLWASDDKFVTHSALFKRKRNGIEIHSLIPIGHMCIFFFFFFFVIESKNDLILMGWNTDLTLLFTKEDLFFNKIWKNKIIVNKMNIKTKIEMKWKSRGKVQIN